MKFSVFKIIELFFSAIDFIFSKNSFSRELLTERYFILKLRSESASEISVETSAIKFTFFFFNFSSILFIKDGPCHKIDLNE